MPFDPLEVCRSEPATPPEGQMAPEVPYVTLRRCVDQSLPEVPFDPPEVCGSEPA